jgi:hypothetical protein
MGPDPGGEDDRTEGDGGVSPDASPEAPAVSIDPAVLDLDYVFDVLSSPRRRYLMYALAENPEWTLTDLATKLVAWETDADEGDVAAHDRDRAYLSLYHTHVPKLVDAGVVEFDPETERIARDDHTEQVLAVLSGAGNSLDAAQEQHAGRSYEPEGPTE